MRATKVNAGLAESNGKLLLGIWRDSFHVTCGLTACTPGSAPGPTLGNEYGKTLPFIGGSASIAAAGFLLCARRPGDIDRLTPSTDIIQLVVLAVVAPVRPLQKSAD